MSTRQQADTFEMTGWRLDDSLPVIHFEYICSRFGSFRESVSFPSIQTDLSHIIDEDLSGLISLLHIALGVSYYKCAAAQTIILPPIAAAQPAVNDMAMALYTEGLAEFFIRAELPYPTTITLTTRPADKLSHDPLQNILPPALPGHSDQAAPKSALVAFGGGKDSYVARAIIKKSGVDATLCSVVMSDKVAATLQATAPDPILFAHRDLDPKLKAVAEEGAFNGHVPITAINSLVLLILAHMRGADYVVFANERSADEPTIILDGLTANHQYSKSSFFEQSLRAAVDAIAPNAPVYFSVLRPFSEIWIGQAFARLKTPFAQFTSCNRNFQITGDTPPRWCGNCAKCAFTSLILAPFITFEEVKTIFPDIFPNQQNLMPLYKELCGLSDQKPWDCVGTINECRASVWQMSQQEAWKNTKLVKELLPEILQHADETQLDQFWQDGLVAREQHFVPPAIIKAAHDL